MSETEDPETEEQEEGEEADVAADEAGGTNGSKGMADYDGMVIRFEVGPLAEAMWDKMPDVVPQDQKNRPPEDREPMSASDIAKEQFLSFLRDRAPLE